MTTFPNYIKDLMYYVWIDFEIYTEPNLACQCGSNSVYTSASRNAKDNLTVFTLNFSMVLELIQFESISSNMQGPI